MLDDLPPKTEKSVELGDQLVDQMRGRWLVVTKSARCLLSTTSPTSPSPMYKVANMTGIPAV